MSQTVHIAIENVAVDYNFCGSDHIPFAVDIEIRAYFKDTADRDEGASFKWDFQNEMKVDWFYTTLCANLDAGYDEDLFCMNEFCCSMMHRRTICQQKDKLITTILTTGTTVFGDESRQTYIRPGWNEYVKNCYEESRRAFLQWRRDASPRNGFSANLMRQKRPLFKIKLRQCKRDEELMRADASASKLRSGKVLSFWSDVSRMSGRA